ncbi:MAG: mycothiol synthase [Acidimicrobiales bacterium]|nr:mycothiol synthase [Acidimicrobiales bacterium]
MGLAISHPDRGEFRWSVTVPPAPDRPDDAALVLALADVIERCRLEGPGTLQVWVEDVRADDDDLLAHVGLTAYRDLLRLRRALPAEPSGIATRSFVPGEDDDAFLRVNNRAFHWHPEQGGLTATDLEARTAEPWFDTAGFRLLVDDGELAGFCWTKVHTDVTPKEGEIYAIAVDPAWHGRGLGGALTLAGLEHLSEQGLTVAILYVESDNRPALAVYERLGFVEDSTNRAYRLDIGEGAA